MEGKKSDVMGEKQKESRYVKDGDQIALFFFTNLPESYESKKIWNFFKRYTNIMELVILVKRDKQGHKFWFVRFEGRYEARMLALKLDKTFIGNQKLMVNTPRFEKGV